MAWILVGGAILIAGFAYVMVKLTVLLARLILVVGASALRLLGSVLR